jgi:hypothetical protein
MSDAPGASPITCTRIARSRFPLPRAQLRCRRCCSRRPGGVPDRRLPGPRIALEQQCPSAGRHGLQEPVERKQLLAPADDLACHRTFPLTTASFGFWTPVAGATREAAASRPRISFPRLSACAHVGLSSAPRTWRVDLRVKRRSLSERCRQTGKPMRQDVPLTGEQTGRRDANSLQIRMFATVSKTVSGR